MTPRPVVPFVGTEPTRAHWTDAGADLYAAESMLIPPGAQVAVRTGTSVQLPSDTVGLVAGRSGLAKNHRIRLSNGVGVIDAGFRGEIQVLLANDGCSPYKVYAGERIAQLLVLPIYIPVFQETHELAESSRGEGGFGSTGAA
jgi:dUTP pyrophosphatase